MFLTGFPSFVPSMAVLRDMKRGRDLEQILTQYTTFVKPAFEEFCLPVPKLSFYKLSQISQISWWGHSQFHLATDHLRIKLPKPGVIFTHR